MGLIRNLTLGIALLGCSPTADEPLCDASADADADGLDDCAELEAGTDKNKADTDGDGFSDKDELECVSSPLDGDEVCYACGWEHNDPGDLSGVGPEIGDTLENLRATDQCGDKVDLHDFYGSYWIAFITTEWCNACLTEAAELRERTTAYSQDLDVEFSYFVILFQDVMGEAPNDESAADYAEIIDAGKRIPVLSDKRQAILEATPYDGTNLPGKCVLSDEMQLLDCYTGHGEDLDAIELIRNHAGG